MATCTRCKSFAQSYTMKDGLCGICQYVVAQENAGRSSEDQEEEQRDAERVTLSTEAMAPEGAERLGIVCAEVPYGMHIGKDILSGFRDVFGGRAKALEGTLKDARKEALAEIRLAAHRLGADSVVALQLSYGSVSTGGATNIVLVTATGTAIRTRKD